MWLVRARNCGNDLLPRLTLSLAAGLHVDAEKERVTTALSSTGIVSDLVRLDREHFLQLFSGSEGPAVLPLGPAKELDRTLAGHVKALDFDIIQLLLLYRPCKNTMLELFRLSVSGIIPCRFMGLLLKP